MSKKDLKKAFSQPAYVRRESFLWFRIWRPRKLDVSHTLSVSETNSEANRTKNEMFRERIRQARLSFNLTFSLTLASAFINIVSVALLLSERISEGKFSAVVGIASSVVGIYCFRLNKEANDRLDQFQYKTTQGQ